MCTFIIYFCPSQRVYFKSRLCEHVWVSSEHRPWPQFTCGMGTVQGRDGTRYRHALNHYSKLEKLILCQGHCFMSWCSISESVWTHSVSNSEVLTCLYRVQICMHLTLESYFLLTSGRDGKIGGNIIGTILYWWDKEWITQPQNW